MTWAGCPGQLRQRIKEVVGEPSWEVVKRQPTPTAGSEAQAARRRQWFAPRGRAGMAGSLPAPIPRAPALAASPMRGAQCSLVRGGAREQPAAQCSLLQRAHLLECLFFFNVFFSKSAKGSKSHAQNLLDFQQSIPTYFCTITIETTVFCSRADGLK